MGCLDDIRRWAEALRKNKRLWKLHKMFIEAHYYQQQEFAKQFHGPDFEEKARKYLRSVGLLK